MEFLKGRDLFGSGPSKEIPCLTGKGKPTTATVGAVGCLYMDTDTGVLYKCTKAENGVYTWTQEAGLYYTPVVTQPSDTTMQIAFRPSVSGAPIPAPVVVTLPAGSSDSGQNPSQGGLTTAQINALQGMFKVCLFDDSKDVNGAISAFEEAFGITGGGETPGEPDEPVVTTYSVEYELVNVSSNNSAAAVAEGAAYSAVLTAAGGYTLDGAAVSVTMGGVDITATAYADGVISIAAVTGDISIFASAVQTGQEVEAVLPGGYKAYFDLRNRPASTADHTTAHSLDPTDGEGMLYAWYASTAGDDYGSALTNKVYSDTITANHEYAFGPAFTWAVHSYTDASLIAYPNGYGKFSNLTLLDYIAKYNTSDGTGSTEVATGGPKTTGYHTYTVVSDGAALRIYLGADLVQTYDGANYEDFVGWYSVFMHTKTGSCKTTAIALYERALSAVEIVEMVAYFKTLEVSA